MVPATGHKLGMRAVHMTLRIDPASIHPPTYSAGGKEEKPSQLALSLRAGKQRPPHPSRLVPGQFGRPLASHGGPAFIFLR